MSLSILIPDANVRHLSDAVLADRLARDIATGIRSGSRTALVGGYRVLVNDGSDYREYANCLDRRNPCDATVSRHADGSVDVALAPSISVALIPAVSA